jgi:general secretion pathway protein D
MKRSAPLIALALALALAAPLAAQQTVNLRDADIRAFIQDASRATGRTFIVDPRVQGKVTVVSERPLSRAAYFELFLSTLRANGFVAVPAAGGALRIQPLDTAAQTAPAPGGGANRFVTEVIRLNAIDAASAIETLRPLVSREGQLTANRVGNSIVVADFADNVRRIRALVGQIDRERAATRVIPLRNAGAREIAQSLNQLAGGREGAPATVSVVAVDSANSLALRGDPVAVARLADIAAELDRRAAAGSDIRVIFLQHADAERLLPVLQQLVGQSPTTSGGAGGAAGARSGTGRVANTTPTPAPANVGGGGSGENARAVIARYEGANALVISASSDVQRTLGEVIRQLDTRREQVLVEAVIVEISDNAARRLGVQFLLAGTQGSSIPFAVTNYSNSAPNILTVAGAVVGESELDPDSDALDDLRSAAAQAILGATGGTFGFGGELGNDAIFGAVINAVRSDNASNILSTPSVMTLDNQEARILVGQEIPVSTGEALSGNFDNAFRTIQRQNVGIQLEVKPQINAGGAIKLFLRQEVSSIAGPVSDDFNELILNKREIETTVTVDDGDIIALGGLIDENERRTIERIPLLGDIPVLGELFKSRARSKNKTNLMVFIRPRIVRSQADARQLAAERYDYMRAQQIARDPKADPNSDTALDALVKQYMRTTPPTLPPEQRLAPTAGPQTRVIVPSTPGQTQVIVPPPGGTVVVPPAPAQPQVIVPQGRTSTQVIRVPVPEPKKK